MSSTKKTQLAEFSRRAMQRLHDKKIPKKCTLHVPSLEEGVDDDGQPIGGDITIRNLDYEEIAECMNMEEGKDSNRSDKYAIYLAVTEPNLKQVAQEVMALEKELPAEERTVREPLDIVNMFDMSEVTAIATEIMKLSGVIGGKKVTVVEQLKN